MAENRHEISEFDRGRVIGAHDAGMSIRKIQDIYNIPKTTIHRIIKEFEENGLTKARPRSGRPQQLDDRSKRHLIQLVEKNHSISLDQITTQMQDITLNPISTSTIRRALHMEGYAGRVGLRKPLVNDINRLKRQKWCHDRLNWNIQWDQIVWSDESRYELFGSKRRKWVWRRPEQRMDKDCLIPTFKSGQKSVMVWGCFTRFGVGPLVRLKGRLAAKDYIQVLETHLIPFLETLSEEPFIFQEDNAPIHTAKKTAKWKLDNAIPLLPWPPQSPDINPIEHLWDELERRVRGRNVLPKNEDELFDFLLEEWERIPMSKLENLVDSMPRRVQAVCNANGYPTRY
jgi:transposase